MRLAKVNRVVGRLLSRYKLFRRMISFHGNQAIKDHYMARLQAHADADEIRQDVYWENGKGCAVGCTIHGDQLAAYETELGISRILARLEDKLFEGMRLQDALAFSLSFLAAVPVGVDVTPVVWKFLAWLLIDEMHGVVHFDQTDAQRTAIEAIANLLIRSLEEEIPADAFYQAGRMAEAVGAAYAAADAADCAGYAVEGDADEAAAYAADTVYAAAYTVSDNSVSRQYQFKILGDKLCDLMSQEGQSKKNAFGEF